MSIEATPVRTLAIASGKGGVGKSFLAINLAWSLGELGQRVLLVELDADAGALSISAGLGEPKPTAPATDAKSLAARALPLPGSSRVQLLRAADIPAQAARSPGGLEPLLTQLPTTWRIIDLAPGMGAQNVLWMRRAAPSLLIGTPELVCVQAMLRLHLQLRRQHAYEWLCARHPELRAGPASLTAARQKLTETIGAAAAEALWNASFASFRPSRWIFNRVLADDTAQLARISQYLARHAGSEAAKPYLVPEDLAQSRCARFGRLLMSSEPTSSAAQAIRRFADELIATSAAPAVRVAARESVA